MNLVDELTQKKALKFQLDNFNKQSIDKTLSENAEGFFNLVYKMGREERTKITDYLKNNYSNYKSDIVFTGSNYEIPFKKIGEKN